MNAYLIDGGEYEFPAFSEDGWTYYEPARAIDVVFAETRGKARAIFLKEYALYWFEWTSPISIRLIAKSVDREAGIAKADDEYWWAENWPFPDPLLESVEK